MKQASFWFDCIAEYATFDSYIHFGSADVDASPSISPAQSHTHTCALSSYKLITINALCTALYLVFRPKCESVIERSGSVPSFSVRECRVGHCRKHEPLLPSSHSSYSHTCRVDTNDFRSFSKYSSAFIWFLSMAAVVCLSAK